MNLRRVSAVLALAVLALPVWAQDDVVQKIKDEGLNRSQLMQTLSYLTDVIGPRLTASPNMKRANEWTRDTLSSWGLKNAHLEAWGPFGRGWSLERFSCQVVAPQCIPVIAYPKAWSPGLKKAITADVVYVEAKTEEELNSKYKGKLGGKIVLNNPLREVQAHFDPQGTRWTDAQLAEMASDGPVQRQRPGQQRFQMSPEMRAQFALAGTKMKLYMDEGVALVVDQGRGDGGTVFVQSASMPGATPFGGGGGAGGPAGGIRPAGGANAAGQNPAAGGNRGNPTPGQNPSGGEQTAQAGNRAGNRNRQTNRGQQGRSGPWSKDAKTLPQIVLAGEHYNRIIRMLQAGEPVKMAVEMQVKFHDSDLMGYNTVAEIPGVDKPDEIVMLGGHMDSWHTGTGATDNAAGCAVAMEACRIIQTLGLKPRRTIRIALWSGEEEGLLGSRAYVTEHFGSRESGRPFVGGEGNADPPRLVTKPEFDKISAYFNLDNGTGKIRGIYLQGNAQLRDLFTEWLKPFSDMGAKTVTLRNTGGTDHQSFDGIGIPGFQFIQDEIEYESRTHHSNMDVFDRIQAADMKQAAVIMATFVYNTAVRDEKLPRKSPVAPANR